MKKIYYFALFFCFNILTCNGLTLLEVNSVVDKYILAEERQNYSNLYQLFSVSMKNRLKHDNAIAGSLDYVKLRQSSESKWYGFSEKGRKNIQGKIAINFTVFIEENGERERVPVVLILLYEGLAWRIDSIDY